MGEIGGSKGDKGYKFWSSFFYYFFMKHCEHFTYNLQFLFTLFIISNSILYNRSQSFCFWKVHGKVSRSPWNEAYCKCCKQPFGTDRASRPNKSEKVKSSTHRAQLPLLPLSTPPRKWNSCRQCVRCAGNLWCLDYPSHHHIICTMPRRILSLQTYFSYFHHCIYNFENWTWLNPIYPSLRQN